MFPFKNSSREIGITKIVCEYLDELSKSSKRLLKRVSNKIENGEPAEKYFFYSQGLSNDLTKILVGNMLKENKKVNSKARIKLFQKD